MPQGDERVEILWTTVEKSLRKGFKLLFNRVGGKDTTSSRMWSTEKLMSRGKWLKRAESWLHRRTLKSWRKTHKPFYQHLPTWNLMRCSERKSVQNIALLSELNVHAWDEICLRFASEFDASTMCHTGSNEAARCSERTRQTANSSSQRRLLKVAFSGN